MLQTFVAVLSRLARFLYHLALLEMRSRLKYAHGYYHCPHNHRVRPESGRLRREDFAHVGDGQGSRRHDLSQQAASIQGQLYGRGHSASQRVI